MNLVQQDLKGTVRIAHVPVPTVTQRRTTVQVGGAGAAGRVAEALGVAAVVRRPMSCTNSRSIASTVIRAT
jgi:hypothetical protein